MPNFLRWLGGVLTLGLFVGPMMTVYSMTRSFRMIAESTSTPDTVSLAQDISTELLWTVIGVPLGIVGVALFVIGSLTASRSHAEDDEEAECVLPQLDIE